MLFHKIISKIFKYSSYLNSVLKILLFIALGELCTKEFKFREATIIKYLLNRVIVHGSISTHYIIDKNMTKYYYYLCPDAKKEK
jgi:hypothetical protein